MGAGPNFSRLIFTAIPDRISENRTRKRASTLLPLLRP